MSVIYEQINTGNNNVRKKNVFNEKKNEKERCQPSLMRYNIKVTSTCPYYNEMKMKETRGIWI